MFFYFVERKQVIAQTIEEVKAEFKAKEEARKNRVQTQNEKDGKYTSSQLLARFFKRPSKGALKLGQAQLRYEQMVRRADRKLSEIRRNRKVAQQDADSPMARAEALAEELFQRPGSLLRPEEIGEMFEESECGELIKAPSCRFPTVNRFRTINGTCNNLLNPILGAARTPFARLTPPLYEDGISSLRGTLQAMSGEKKEDSIMNIGPFVPPNPSPRQISETVILNVTQDELPFTHLLMQWGQFLDHDLDLGPELEEECEGCKKTEICQPIPVPDLDRTFGVGTPNNANCLPLRRSLPVCEFEKPLSFNPREQINDLTSFIDGSMIYGSNEELAKAVRAFRGGLLLTGPPFPGRQPSLPVDQENRIQCPNRMDCFLCGEVRCNEQFSLTVMHTIWVREHNLCAKNLARINPFWDDERLYQECRRIIGALVQKITYEDYLPKVLGYKNYDFFIGPFKGYNPKVDPSVPNSFATAAYRYGHSLIRPQFDRLDVNFKPLPIGPLNLVNAFFNPDQFRISLGTDPIARGWVSVNSRRMDEFMNSVLTTQLFANTFSIPLDLASLNLQRGREHGLAPYPIWRNFCYEVFGKVSDFENKLTLVRFLQLYGSLETLDLWIGGLAEERLPDSLLGATFSCIFGLTFSRVRDGDRFFYRQPGVFTEDQLKQIRLRSISNVLCDTSDQILSIQPDAFLSNQSRIPCSQLPQFDYTVFSEDACYFRARIRPRNVEVPISVFSRSVSTEFIFTERRVPPSRRNEFQCVQIQCPTPTIPVDLVVFSTRQLLEDLSISPEDNLPPSNSESSSIYRAELPSALFDEKRGGLFRSMEACEASRNEFAFTFEFSTFTSEAKALEQELASQANEGAGVDSDNKVGEKMEVEITDDVMKILQTRNKHLKKVAMSEEAKKVGVAKDTKAKAEATDEMLLKELESALKSI